MLPLPLPLVATLVAAAVAVSFSTHLHTVFVIPDSRFLRDKIQSQTSIIHSQNKIIFRSRARESGSVAGCPWLDLLQQQQRPAA